MAKLLSEEHKRIASERSKNWYKNNPDRVRNTKLLKTFGITLEDYNEFSEFCGNKCCICSKPETIKDKRSGKVRRLAIDHDHKNGVIRGLLCSKCNRGIGMFDESIKTLKHAINYLESYKEALHAANSK